MTRCREQFKTKSGKIRSAREVAEHLHARFGTAEWQAEHSDEKINQIVVHIGLGAAGTDQT